MNINCKKTKEMILGPLSKESSTPLLIGAKPVQRVAKAPATSRMAKHVLCSNCLRCLKDEIVCVVNCLGR